ncbi:MAG TPA: SusF/SusE family outer membrane protein [Petrimonas sp.]|uniref:SusE domain-containing protein n=1 Tax=Petrimonas sp. TaxID=2023866 RepID=UPI00175B4192|nr:SusF/SusE family outer membrane protein [Petrimonas sp.]
MKKNYLYTVLLGIIFILSGCEDERTPIMQLNKAAEFNALTQNQFVFNATNASAQFPVISWKPVDYGVSAAVNYVVTLTNKTANKSIVIGETTGTELSFTNAQMNSFLAKAGGYPGQTYDIEISMKSGAYDYTNDAATNPLKFKVTPYDPNATDIDWPYAYVATGYPDWDYTTAFMMGDPENDGTYKGYVYFAENGQTFAIVDGANTSSTLATGQTIENKGLYEITVNASKEVSITGPFNWGVIGSATSGGWSTDTPMEYDPDTRLWKLITPLIGGEFKFRGNNDWAFNYGAEKGKEEELSGNLFAGGENIRILKTSPYIVTLNLTHAGKYSYSLEETTIELSSTTMYMPGSYQGWKPEDPSVYTLTSAARDFKYVGYHYIPANTEFKFLDGNAWGATEYALSKGTSIAWNSEHTVGTFNVASSDNDNIKIEYANYYKISLDIKKMTAEFKKTGWEVIGNATPGGWDKGTVMSYNPDTKLWSVTITLADGEFKFRWDGAWDKNLGGALNALTQDGANLTIAPGTYAIVLDDVANKATMTKQ